jgi:hypothetical protein
MNLATDDERIVAMIRRTLCRNPTAAEVAHAKTFLQDASANIPTAIGVTEDPDRNWILLAHALLASNEFTFLD